MQNLKLAGLDNFSQERLDEFWSDYNPEEDEPKILGVNLSCSDVCNLDCRYCYVGEREKSNKELTLAEQKNIITQASELGAETVVFCGDGEPSMDRNLVGIVKHANELNMKTIIVTNGVIFADDKQCQSRHNMSGKKLLKTIYNNEGSLIVKLDTLVEEKYDEIVGVKNSFSKLKKSLELIEEVGFNEIKQINDKQVTRLAFSSVIMKDNINELKDLKAFADVKKAQFICKLPSLVGQALENIDKMLEVSEYEKIRKEKLSNYTAKRETLMVDSPRCMAWHYGICIDNEGEVRECYTSSYSEDNRVGNVREDPLKELIEKRNRQSDLACEDYCPVKTEINKSLQQQGLKKIYN